MIYYDDCEDVRKRLTFWCVRRMSSQSLFTHSQSFKQLPQKMDDSKNMKKKTLKIWSKIFLKRLKGAEGQKCGGMVLIDISLWKDPSLKFAFVYAQTVILLQTGIVYRESGKWCEQNSTGHGDSCAPGSVPAEIHPRCSLDFFFFFFYCIGWTSA